MSDAKTEAQEYVRAFYLRDPFSWRIEDYSRFVEYACGCVYPAPPSMMWATRCPEHDKGALRVGPVSVRR